MKRPISALIVTWALMPWVVHAHAKLERAMPANGSVVATAPTSVMLMFNEAATLTAASIQKTGDKAAQKLGPLPKAPAANFTLNLPKLASGSYTVKYRVLTDDNHVMSGTTKFTVSADAKAAPKPDATMKGMDMKKPMLPAAPVGK